MYSRYSVTAKSLQSCPTLRPHRRQPTRLPRSWDSPGKNAGVGCHFFLQRMKVNSLSRVRLPVTPWTAAHQAPPSMGFSSQEYWSGVPLPSPITYANYPQIHVSSPDLSSKLQILENCLLISPFLLLSFLVYLF